MYIRSCRGIRAIIIDINRRKKETINPFSPLLNYFKYLSDVASLPKLYSIYTKPKYKWSFRLYIT